MLDAVEEDFDQVAFFVEIFIKWDLYRARSVAWNNALHLHVGYLLTNLVRVITLVAHEEVTLGMIENPD